MTKLVFPVILICVVYVANSFSIDSTFNRVKNKCEDGTHECLANSTICAGNGEKHYCKCLQDLVLIENVEEEENLGACRVLNKCEDGSHKCPTNSTICVGNHEKHYCKCMQDLVLIENVDEKDNLGPCRVKNKCEDATHTCPANSTICVGNHEKHYCKCLEDLVLIENVEEEENLGPCRENLDEHNYCLNGGICRTIGHYSFCECIPGTVGSKCESVVKCDDGTLACKPGSESNCGFNINSKRAECLCKDELKYDILNETCRETCDEHNYCQNGGTCKTIGHYSFCECIPGTVGPKCGSIDECEDGRLVCEPRGESYCGFNINSKRAECFCKDELKYDIFNETCRETCDEHQYCLNGGTCKTLGHYSFCECVPGTKGPKCEVVIECADGSLVCKPESEAKCGFNINSKRAECLCKDELKYDILNETCRETCDAHNKCLNGGTCRTIGHYSFCECIPGTAGHKCGSVVECDDGRLVCKPGSESNCGFNINLKRAECLCKNKLKYDRINEKCRGTCSEGGNQCKNGAKCAAVGIYSFCKCLKGTSGTFCDMVDECIPENKRCGENSGATCKYNVHLKVVECVCEEKTLEYDESLKLCRGLCREGDIQCKNGAKCTTDGTHSFCKCLEGTSGTFCDMVDECIPENEKCGANSGAKCKYNVDLRVAECVCDEKTLEYDAYLELCRDLTSTPGELSTRSKYFTTTPGELSTRSKSMCDEDKNDCVNGAECLQLGNQRFCHCLKGTYGDKCQHMWDCDERYNLKCNYRNGEICAYNTTLEESECLCVESEFHYDTKQEMCRKKCLVGNHDCKNGANCITFGSYGFCECHPGTYGHKCEIIRDCDIINCINSTGARCEYNRNLETAECVCDNGLKYDGSQCRETCDPVRNYCQNGAMCEKEGNYSFCRCIPGSYGNKCETVEDCESQKVICNENNGAKCGINMDTRVAGCMCENGLKYDEESLACRETCNLMRNECKNGAHCKRIGTYLFCECLPGTSGHRCENVEEKHQFGPLLLLILLCITSGFLLVSTLILVTVFIKFRSGELKK